MRSVHPMMWQYQVAKRLRWWMNLPLRPLNVFGYILDYVWKFQSWYEWKIVNRVVIWYANRNAPPGWKTHGIALTPGDASWYREGFSDGMKEIFHVSTRSNTEETTSPDDTEEAEEVNEKTSRP